MQPAASQLAEALKSVKLQQPHTAVINNVDVAVADSDDAIKDALVRQLYCPVRWTETVEQIAKMGVETAYEVGPGKVLTGLNKRITKSFGCSALNTLDSLNSL
jgi:[acyl-carrier-protein] S-malonyltransferase